MTPTSILVNTYVKTDEKFFIDNVSKLFILCQLPLGIIRIPLLMSKHFIYTLISVIYSVACMSYLTNGLYVADVDTEEVFVINNRGILLQIIFLKVYDLISINRLRRFYNELNEFDNEMACRPKMGVGTIHNLIHICFTLVYITLFYVLSYFTEMFNMLFLLYLPIILCHVFEIHYHAHLLSLMVPRLRLINYYMELSLTQTKVKKSPNVKEFSGVKSKNKKRLCDIGQLMNLYHIMIKAYDYLIDSIKWQLLITLIATFVDILICTYNVALMIINGQAQVMYVVTSIGMAMVNMMPLFGPCLMGDRVHAEVRKLRELLASRLYENQLDKSCRGIARALLAWTETRDLSFCLLRMLDIDISLPFKFIALLITYLIILLQFQKVINPTNTP